MKETNPKTLIRIDNLKSLYSNIKDDFFLENNKNISFTINSIKSPALAEFEKESTNIFFIPVSCQENYSGNYDNYIQSTLSHICSLRALPYEKILENENLHMNYPSDDIKKYIELFTNNNNIAIDSVSVICGNSNIKYFWILNIIFIILF